MVEKYRGGGIGLWPEAKNSKDFATAGPKGRGCKEKPEGESADRAYGWGMQGEETQWAQVALQGGSWGINLFTSPSHSLICRSSPTGQPHLEARCKRIHLCNLPVLKLFGLRTPLQKLLRTPKSFCLCSLYILIFPIPY